MIKNQEALKRGSYYLNRMNLKAKDYMIKLGDYAVFEEDGKFVAETSMEEMDFDSFKDIERYFTILYEDYLAQKFANEIPELSQSFIYDGLGEGNRNAEIKSNGKRCLPIRKHREAREKRYSFGYAVFLILALMK